MGVPENDKLGRLVEVPGVIDAGIDAGGLDKAEVDADEGKVDGVKVDIADDIAEALKENEEIEGRAEEEDDDDDKSGGKDELDGDGVVISEADEEEPAPEEVDDEKVDDEGLDVDVAVDVPNMEELEKG